MTKRIILTLFILCLLILPSIKIANAADLDDAQFALTVRVSNNSTSANTNQCVTLTGANSTSWQALEYLNSTCNDSALQSAAGSDLAFMPGYGNSPWIIFEPSINGDSYKTDILYIGGDTDMDAKIAIFTDSAGMTISDAANMEISDNGSANVSAHLLSGTSGNISMKDDALEITWDGSGNVTAAIGVSGILDSQVNEDTNTQQVYADSWRGQSFTTNTTAWIVESISFWAYRVGSPGDITCHIRSSSANVPSASTSNDIAIGTMNGNTITTNVAGAEYTITLDTLAGLAANTQYAFVLEAASGDGSNKIFLHSDSGAPYTDGSGANSNNDDVSWSEQASLDYYFKVTGKTGLVASGVSSGENEIAIENVSSVNTTLYINGVIESQVPVITIPDNANDWIIGSIATPYILYYQHYVAGSLVSDIEWQYDTTFTDLSGNSNDATPSFRTTSTDSYISANITQFQPMSEATAPAYAVSDAPDFYSSNITTTGNFTSGGVSPGGMPGTAIITDVASTGGTPNIWVWGIIAIFSIAGVGIFLSYFERRFGGGSGTMTLRIITAAIILGLLIANDVFDTWMIVLYIMIAAGIAVASRHREIGGTASAHNIVGFLAMAFIGMTIINRIMEGQFITADETAWANTFAFTQTFEVFDLFTIPVINFSFFTEGIPAIMKWDYSFFGGNAQMIQYLMYSVTAVMSFIIFGLLIGLMYNAFRVR